MNRPTWRADVHAKRGLMERADVLVVNKADGDNVQRAKRAAHELKQAARLLHSAEDWQPPVLTASARQGTGLPELWAEVQRHSSGDALARARMDLVSGRLLATG